MLKLIGKFLVVLTVGAWTSAASAYPIADTVTVEDKEWAQLDLFTNLTWNDINSVCPGGVCGNGTLNGFDMQGWSWATLEDMNSLFNHYIGFAALGPGPDVYSGGLDTFIVPGFAADGWRATGLLFGNGSVEGRISDSDTLTARLLRRQFPTYYPSADVAITNGGQAGTDGQVGAWFVRSPAQVPIPATLPLLGLGLAALGYSRRKRNLLC